MNSRLSVLVAPRDGLHYQQFLYREVEKSGVRVYYAQGPTKSQTLNLILAPAVLLWFRLRGARVLHIHWVFQFSLPWAKRRRWALRLMEWWFGVYLWISRALGFAIVWTAHDLLPHEQVFANDAHARDLLLSYTAMVIALSDSTAGALRELGVSNVRVIPMGSYSDPYPVSLTTSDARLSFGFADQDVVISLIGRVEPYKGADLLLRAVAGLPESSRIKVLLAGLCTDEVYLDELTGLARDLGARASTTFTWVPDDDLARYFQATDVAVFPFREITNSASVMLAQSFGRPIVIPNLPALRDIPDEAAIRFEPGDDLTKVLEQTESLSDERYQEMSAASIAWATRADWRTAAADTIETYESVRRGPHRREATR
ncbi:MAG: glycosyltransferase family 4 protein [Acidimicrobiales bacterium]